MTGGSAGPQEVLVRFPTHPHSVRTARQLVSDTLGGWGLQSLVDDARLVVSELTTNALLRSGSRWFLLSVAATATAEVRLAVGDEGLVPAAAVVRRSRPAGGTATVPRPETTTGRGLGIVDELAHAWGVSTDGTTKWVWAELSTGGAARAAPAARPGDAQAPTGPLPPGWHVVRLVDCPVALSLAQDDHLDELVRELQLVAPSSDEPELAAVIRGLLDGQAQARHMGRRTAQDAAADALCERERLLALASPPGVRALRAWMRDEVRDQIRHGRPPRSYDEWRSAAEGA